MPPDLSEITGLIASDSGAMSGRTGWRFSPDIHVLAARMILERVREHSLRRAGISSIREGADPSSSRRISSPRVTAADIDGYYSAASRGRCRGEYFP